MSDPLRRVSDSMGEIEVPAEALYQAQTARALQNFTLSSFRFPAVFIESLAAIKRVAAVVNGELGLLPPDIAQAVAEAAAQIEAGEHRNEFPVDVFQTGSGTSTNMNANEVIATLSSRALRRRVHPNDHVNFGQSSNDVIPSTIQVSAAREVAGSLLPCLGELADAIAYKASQSPSVVKTARTHLMDAVPMRLDQQLGGWEAQVRESIERLEGVMPRLLALPIGGAAVGTGLNAHPEFGARVAAGLAATFGLDFQPARNRFARLSSQDVALESSAALRGVAVAISKICTDLRWMNSGPVSGLGEIELKPLQPGSSMMPGKVNPVIPEAVAMVCAQVVGCDATINVAALSSVFELNVMQPVVAWNLLTGISLLSNGARALSQAIGEFRVNEKRLRELAERNPIVVTALAPRIGYEVAAHIAHESMTTGRGIAEIAREQTSIPPDELEKLLDPANLTNGGFQP